MRHIFTQVYNYSVHIMLFWSDIPLQKQEKNMIYLQQKIDLYNENMTCKICLDKTVNIAFRPCGHCISCSLCANQLQECGVCRSKIQGCIKVIIPTAKRKQTGFVGKPNYLNIRKIINA